MKINLFTIAFLILTTLLTGCKKEKAPVGKADFTYELLPMGGIKVIFTGTGIPVSWNFGGAARITNNNVHSFVKTGEVTVNAATKEVVAYFEKDGEYTIALKSQLNSTSSIDEKSLNIRISGTPNAFKLKRVALHFMHFGDQWDNGISGPDISFAYLNYINNQPSNYISTKFNDIDESSLPLNYTLPSSQTFSYNDNGWNNTYDSRFIVYAVEDTDDIEIAYGYIYHPMKNTINSNPYSTLFRDYKDDKLSFEIEVEWITE